MSETWDDGMMGWVEDLEDLEESTAIAAFEQLGLRVPSSFFS